MTAAELRVLVPLLLKLGMQAVQVYALLRQHGVTEAQITEADLQNDIDVYERIQQLGGAEGGR
jgi:hypothetical protein